MTDNTPRGGAPDRRGAGPEDRSGSSPPPSYGPPPGYGQPGYGQPGHGQPGYGQPGYGPGGWNAAGVPQPGGIPLRPLGLGDIWSGAVTAIRRNPLATVGLAAIVLGIVGVVTTSLAVAVSRAAGGTSPVSPEQLLALVLDLIGQLILTGLLTMVIGRAVLGQQITIGQAWNLARGRLGALLGATLLTLLIVIGLWIPWGVILVILIAAHLTGAAVAWGILGALATLAVTALAGVRLSLAAPATVLERCGPAGALRRSWELTRRSFWRLFGILLLTGIVVGLASLILELPFIIIGVVVGGAGFGTGSTATASVAGIIVGGVGAIVAGAIARPVVSGVLVLLYVDMRMRKEGLDLALRNAVQNREMTAEEFATLWQPPAASPFGAGPGPAGPPPSW